MNPGIATAALLPRPLRVGALTLLPLTIRTALELETLDSPLLDPGRDATALDVYLAAWLLSGQPYQADAVALRDEVISWVDSADLPPLETIGGAVAEVIAAAYAPGARTSPPRDEFESYGDPSEGNGLGWALNLVEGLCARYGWPLAAVLDLPLATALALSVAARIREGERWEDPSYATLARFDREDAASAFGVVPEREQVAHSPERPGDDVSEDDAAKQPDGSSVIAVGPVHPAGNQNVSEPQPRHGLQA